MPGHISKLHLHWTEDSEVDILLIYAPNELQEKLELYRYLVTYTAGTQLDSPIILGNFNCVEDVQ